MIKKILYLLLFSSAFIFQNSYSQNVGVDVASPVEKLDVAGAIRVGNTSNANAGTIRWTGTAFEGYNGSAWLNLSTPAGITSLNTLTGSVQTFAIGSAGSAPAFSSSGTVHTLNIPFASTSGVSGGLLSNTDYTTIMSSLPPSGLNGQTLRHNGTTWTANSLFINDGTNIGVGSSSPAAKLDVAGKTMTANFQMTTSPTVNFVLRSDASGNATWVDPNTLVNGDNLGNHTATTNLLLNNNWLSNDGGSEGIRVDNTGNVGVGQTPGSAYLDVAGTNAGTTSLQLRSGNPGTGGTSNQITFGYNGSENYRHSIKTRHQSGGTSNAIDFYVWDQPNDIATTIGTLNVMSITGLNNGSVGIGITGPSAQLHTTGSVRFAGLTAASQTAAVMTDGSGNLSTRALNPVAFSGTSANHTPGTGLSGSVYDGTTAQTWSVAYGTSSGTAVQGNQAATITAGNGLTGGISADALGDGFTSSLAVGAGTAIQVNADDIAVKFDNSTITTNGSGQLQVANLPASDADYIQNLSVDNNFAAGQAASLDVTANAEIGGTLEVSGTVGIGTTAPGRKLEIYGTAPGIRINDPNATGNSFIELSTVDGGISFFQNTGGRTRIVTGGSERVTFLNSGSVGIGTITPAATLDVNGSAWIRSIPVLGRGATAYDSFGYEARISAAGTTPPLIIDQAGTASFIFNASGNLGIGGVNPGTRLDLGTATSGNKPLIHFHPGTATAVSYVGYAHHDFLMGSYSSGGYSQHYISFGYGADPSRKFHIGSASDGNFDAATTFVTGLTVTSGGNVGVATASPGSKLDVWGTSNNMGIRMIGGRAYFQPSTSAADQGLQVDATNLANGSNMILLSAPNSWSGNFMSGNHNGFQKFRIDQTGAIYALSYGSISDFRIKTNINTLNNESGLKAVKRLNPVTYNWIDPSRGSSLQTGFIAQEVQQIFPDLVTNSGMKSDEAPEGALCINYIGIIPSLVKAIQEQDLRLETVGNENESLKKEIEKLKAENSEFKKDINSFKAEIETIKSFIFQETNK